ncbi:MAG: hypothetical protein AAGF48_12960 [Pseudomonadota bacterium]
MAARLNPAHDQRTRDKIQTSQLVNRLEKFVNGDVEMKPAQVTAALGLLKKTLPDLTTTELKGNLGLTHEEALDELDDAPREGDTDAAAG